VLVQEGRQQNRRTPRLGGSGSRRAALAGLLIGAAVFNFAALWQLAGTLIAGKPLAAGAGPAAAGCTSLSLDRGSGRTVARPCPEPAPWLESGLSAAELAHASR
jgi:hypothetical protein